MLINAHTYEVGNKNSSLQGDSETRELIDLFIFLTTFTYWRHNIIISNIKIISKMYLKLKKVCKNLYIFKVGFITASLHYCSSTKRSRESVKSHIDAQLHNDVSKIFRVFKFCIISVKLLSCQITEMFDIKSSCCFLHEFVKMQFL